MTVSALRRPAPTTTLTPAPEDARSRAAVAPAAARHSALTPWDFVPAVCEERAGTASAPIDPGELAARAADWLARRRADVAALSLAAADDDTAPAPDATRGSAAGDVALHLAAALGGEPDARTLRRVLGGYAHHLTQHRFLAGDAASVIDFLLWEAVIALPVVLGEAAAAEVLRDLDPIKRWARRLAAAHGAAVEAIGHDAVDRAHRRRKAAAARAVGQGAGASAPAQLVGRPTGETALAEVVELHTTG